MRYTLTEGYPAPDSADFADGPSDLYNFAIDADGRFPAWDNGFAAVTKQRTFRVRSTVDSAAISPLSVGFLKSPVTIDFDNTGGMVNTNGAWNQQLVAGDGPSWWYFGGLFSVVASTTPTIGKPLGVAVLVTDTNTDTNAAIQTYIYGDSVESNTSGEFIAYQGIVKCYGSASCFPTFNNGGSVNYVVKAGSLFWGTRLGGA